METSARLLRLLAMFTARATWSAAELAGRLEITERTLRRDVTRLRELGYPIHSTTGRYGGYELGAGGRLPPLLLDDDEAIAVSVALRELSRGADATLGEAALAASAKLRQVLPDQLRDRVDALGEVTVGVERRPQRRSAEAIALPSLMTLAMCCRRGDRVRFDYTAGSGESSERRVEPHRLVSLARRWYLVGFDLDRDDWRTFRVDRIAALVATGHRNAPREAPDAVAQVSEGIAVRAYDLQARVRVFASAAEAAYAIPPHVGVIEPDEPDEHDAGSERHRRQEGDSCIVRIGGDADWIARYVAGLPVRSEVLEPPELRDEMRRLARQLLRQHTGG